MPSTISQTKLSKYSIIKLVLWQEIELFAQGNKTRVNNIFICRWYYCVVIGTLIGDVNIITMRSITDIPTALITVFSILALAYIKKVKEPYLILTSAVLG